MVVGKGRDWSWVGVGLDRIELDCEFFRVLPESRGTEPGVTCGVPGLFSVFFSNSSFGYFWPLVSSFGSSIDGKCTVNSLYD